MRHSVLIFFIFFFNDTATTEIYTLSLHERSSDLFVEDAAQIAGERVTGVRHALLISVCQHSKLVVHLARLDKRSEEHTSELQSHSDLVCRLLLEKKK